MIELKALRVKQISAALLAVFLLVYLHPYYGIRHDAILYLGQSLLRLDFANFKSDLFFAFGSQASFTVFPYLIAQLLRQFDAAIVFSALTLAGLFFFLAASAKLLSRVLPSPQWYWGLLALLILPSTYGGHFIFGYAETFFTGRSLAEPLVLFALAAYMNERMLLASVLWLVAAVLHPLQAIPAALIWWCDRVANNRRWLHLLWFPVALQFAAVMRVPLAEAWMAPFDSQWFEWIVAPSRHVFITRWTQQDFLGLGTDIFLVSLLHANTSGRTKSLAKALLAATLVGFTASLLLADWLRLVLPTGLQLWRVQWLLHWFAVAGVPYLVHRYWAHEGYRSVRTWLLLIVVAFGISRPDNYSSIAAGATAIGLFILWPKLSSRIGQPTRTALLIALPTALLISFIKHAWTVYSKYKLYGNLREVIRPEFAIFHLPIVAGILVAIGLYLYRNQKGSRGWLTALLIVLIMHAGTEWDRRSKWTKYIESASHNPNIFGQPIEEGAQVYWSDELAAPWLVLHRPSYFNGQQGSGILFNRQTAAETYARVKVMETVSAQVSVCRIMNELNKSDNYCTVDLEAVTDACKKSKNHLAYLIIDANLPGKSFGSWKIIGGPKGDYPITYYAYRCQDLIRASK